MSNASPKPKASIDLAGTHTRNRSSLLHCNKLQHSPSLPNIYFPSNSQSGLSANNMSIVDKSFSTRPSAPSSPSPTSVDETIDKAIRARHVKYASLDPARRDNSSAYLKTHARRRTERDQPHSLLTPPLTPSSSIRTTNSDSASTNAAQSLDHEDIQCHEEIKDSDEESTRILLLGNVNRQISVDELKSAIIDVLLSAIADNKVSEEIIKARAIQPFPPDEFLKGINERYLAAKGIIPVVFFDVRVAKMAKELLTDRKCDRLRGCIGKQTDDNGHCLGLSGRLVALEELTESLGYSTFLDSIDGQFILAVQKNKSNITNQKEVISSEDDLKTNSTSTVSHSREGVSFLTVQNLLKSIGSLRSFRFLRRHEDKDGVISLFYSVEYHDSRVSLIAFKELSNQTMLGMKFSTLPKVGSSLASLPQSSSISGNIPFPNTSTAGESFSGLAFGTAGSKSNIRQHYNFPTANENFTKERDLEEINCQNTTFIPGGEPSPRYLYNTPIVNGMTHSTYTQDTFNVAGHPVGVVNSAPIVPSQNDFRVQGANAWDNEVIYRSDSISPCYDGACWYCPSTRPVPNNQNYNPFPISSTPSPVYYTGLNSTPVPGVVNSAISPHPFFPYEYMDPHMQSIPNVSPWVVDPAIAAVAPGPNVFVPLVPINGPSPAPYFLREEAPLQAPRPYPGLYVRTSDAIPQQQPHNEREVRPPMSPPPFAHISTPESKSPTSQRSRSLVCYEPQPAAGANPASSGQTERNQLNLAKIADGGDTRTTVMIKNIPNKMSDMDLTSYIAKVCPRRIDFLYLRMDFKNGCNVGYAFVNFISVEDLLHFARERLGQKWNMFSSEKVLQMSYANYQGKEALIEKFKNSAIMDEREAWRPRIFYSSGKDQGLPEPFPAPTHIRRKERSSFNRGTLFPPGTNSHSFNTHDIGLLNNSHRRLADDNRAMHHRSVDRVPAHLREGRTPDSGGLRHEGHVDKGPHYRTSSFRGSGQK